MARYRLRSSRSSLIPASVAHYGAFLTETLATIRTLPSVINGAGTARSNLRTSSMRTPPRFSLWSQTRGTAESTVRTLQKVYRNWKLERLKCG
jgi:hypothetical protein